MQINKSTTTISIDGKNYGSVEEMDESTRQSYESAMGQISKISEITNKSTKDLSVNIGSGVVETKSNNGMLIFILGVLVGGGLMAVFGGSGSFSSRICPLITDKNLCEKVGCIADPVNIMPAPGTPGWFCEARDLGSK